MKMTTLRHFLPASSSLLRGELESLQMHCRLMECCCCCNDVEVIAHKSTGLQGDFLKKGRYLWDVKKS